MVVRDIAVVDATSVGMEEVNPVFGDRKGSSELSVRLLDEHLPIFAG